MSDKESGVHVADELKLLHECHDRLGSCIDQVGHPDYSLRELVKHLREIRDDLFTVISRPAVSEREAEFAWLIEDTRKPLSYYAGVEWTADHMKAIRYSREQDAMRAILSLPNGWHLIGRAVEHGWHDRALGRKGS